MRFHLIERRERERERREEKRREERAATMSKRSLEGEDVPDPGGGAKPAAKRGRWDVEGAGAREKYTNGAGAGAGAGAGQNENESEKRKTTTAMSAKGVGVSLAALQKAKEALKMQKQIAEKLKGLKEKGVISSGAASGAISASIPTSLKLKDRLGRSTKAEAPSFSRPKPLRLDNEGREVDEEGNVLGGLGATREASKLKAKIGQHKEQTKDGVVEEKADEFLDPRMRAGPGARRKRSTFDFIQEGRFQKLAQRERLKNKFAELGYKESSAGESWRTGAAEEKGNPNLIPLGGKGEAEHARAEGEGAGVSSDGEDVTVEWWDSVILSNSEYENECGNINKAKITSYIEHPVPIEPPNNQPAPPPQPLKLTKKEQKKLRTQQRQAREKEKQEMIRQGLLEPPKPKVKLSNLVRVLGADATKDPTKIEKEVRAQMEERQQAHEDRNLARKLTPAERREKKMRKMFDPENGLFSAVFKIKSLRNPQHKFKINVNADENMLQGCVVTADTFSLVVVEGCSKSVVRYKKLMLKRIQWDAWIAGEEAPADMEGNNCKLLWEGTIQTPHFKKFRQEVEKTDKSARRYLEDFGLEHLWDLAME